MDIINQSKRINLIVYLSTVLVFFYFSFLAPSNLTEFLLNDNNTAVYSVYARNILEYPIYYRSRKYGKTQISRFRDGYKLIKYMTRTFTIFNTSKS